MITLFAHESPETHDCIHTQLASYSSVAKPSRKQVSKACDHCRARRTRCDHGRPCQPCKKRGLTCNSRGDHNDEARTLPQALKEIQRLRLRVQELEAEVEEHRLRESSRTISSPSHTSSSTTHIPSSSNASSPSQPPVTSHTSAPLVIYPNKNVWEGIYTATARSDQKFYYGPLSAFYFIGRIGCFLSKSLHQSYNEHSMQPKGANKTLGNPVNPTKCDTTVTRRGEPVQPMMSRMQEEHFLSLFWESHHSMFPIIAEDEFRRHYESLWETSQPYRKPSALVDIILAICMQFGWVFLLHNSSSSTNQDTQYDDASIAGRWYYRRSQNLLATELESPSITTLQCHIFSIIYLCIASFRNMAHTTMAMAIRTAQILGLHLEPPEGMPRSERELRKRIWAVLYNIEAKTCLNLGRPFSVHESDIDVTQPSDDRESAYFFNSSLGEYNNEVTWLTYFCQMTKLVNVSVPVYKGLYAKFTETLCGRSRQFSYQDLQGLETCARYVADISNSIRVWVDEVPEDIKLKRRNGGDPMSTDRSPVVIDTTAPLWLQRHRVCLELFHHNICSGLYRPFINFNPGSTPTAERHAVASLNHAIAHTSILHQVLNETDLMKAWQEFFLWQWCATITIIGFLLAYPIHPSTGNARKTIEKAIEIFELFGANFAVSTSAAAITRDLVNKVDLIMDKLRSGIARGGCPSEETPAVNVEGELAAGARAFDTGVESNSGFSEFMDWALTIDSYNNFEDLFADPSAGTDWWGITS